MAKKDI